MNPTTLQAFNLVKGELTTRLLKEMPTTEDGMPVFRLKVTILLDAISVLEQALSNQPSNPS